jgi:hypothetical protein
MSWSCLTVTNVALYLFEFFFEKLGLNDFIRENNLNRQWKYNVFGDV